MKFGVKLSGPQPMAAGERLIERIVDSCGPSPRKDDPAFLHDVTYRDARRTKDEPILEFCVFSELGQQAAEIIQDSGFDLMTLRTGVGEAEARK